MHLVSAKGILSAKNGMNIYRGCTHGCIYCDSRSKCYDMPHSFEDIEVKQNAPELLEAALRRKRHACMVGTGSMCDPYMPCEKELGLTRKCLEIIKDNGCGATLITKSDLVLRDMDLLCAINEQAKSIVQMTMTTADSVLCAKIEPNVCNTQRRAQVLHEMKKNKIDTVVWLSPLLPFINDTEENMRAVLDMCFGAQVRGILCFGAGLTLREGNREYFYSQLDKSFPGLKEKYISTYGNSYSCMSPNNDRLMRIFYSECKKHGVMCDISEIFSYLSTLPQSPLQTSLF